MFNFVSSERNSSRSNLNTSPEVRPLGRAVLKAIKPIVRCTISAEDVALNRKHPGVAWREAHHYETDRINAVIFGSTGTLCGYDFFNYYRKFRTMKIGSGYDAMGNKAKGITPSGRVIRRFNLDEILAVIDQDSDMNLVGPHPRKLPDIVKLDNLIQAGTLPKETGLVWGPIYNAGQGIIDGYAPERKSVSGSVSDIEKQTAGDILLELYKDVPGLQESVVIASFYNTYGGGQLGLQAASAVSELIKSDVGVPYALSAVGAFIQNTSLVEALDLWDSHHQIAA